MSARLEKWLRDLRTYRVALEDLAFEADSTGRLAVEIFGSAGKLTKLRHVQMSKPSLGIAPFQLNVYSVGTTGGSSSPTVASDMQLNQDNATYSGIVRLYTNGPTTTEGTLFKTFQEIDISTGEVMNESFGDRGVINSVTLTGSSQSIGLVVTSTGANVLNGYIEFTEEP